MTAVIWVGVIVAWLAQFAWLVRRSLITMERSTYGEMDNGDRGMALFMAFGVAVFAPFVGAALWIAFDFVTGRTNLLKTPTEVEQERLERAEAEVAAYRENLRVLGLPDPLTASVVHNVTRGCVYCGADTSFAQPFHAPFRPRYTPTGGVR